MCFVVTCWERADLLALVCGVFCQFVTFPLVSWVRCGTWLYRFLIFATLLTLQPPFKLRNSKWCSVSSLTSIEYSSDKQRLWSDCGYAQADLRLCWSHIPHCWKSHVTAHIEVTYKTGWNLNSLQPLLICTVYPGPTQIRQNFFFVINIFHRGPYKPPSRSKAIGPKGSQGVQLLLEGSLYQYF